jgi:hypothetical protein
MGQRCFFAWWYVKAEPEACVDPGFALWAIIIVVVLRWVVHHAGIQAVQRHWPGTEDGFAALCLIAGLRSPGVWRR